MIKLKKNASMSSPHDYSSAFVILKPTHYTLCAMFNIQVLHIRHFFYIFNAYFIFKILLHISTFTFLNAQDLRLTY